MSSIETGFAEIGGHRLETAWIAPANPDRPTIVMLHEGLGSIGLWKDFPQRLARRHRRRHADLFALRPWRLDPARGATGRSSICITRPKSCCRQCCATSRSSGRSCSAIATAARSPLIYAGFRPDGVTGLILEAPHVFVEDLTVASIAQVKDLYRTTDLAGRLRRYHQSVDQTFWGWNNIWLDLSLQGVEYRDLSAGDPLPDPGNPGAGR